MMGATSFWYHASMTEPGRAFDVASIFCILLYFHVFLAAQSITELPCLPHWIPKEWSIQEGFIGVLLSLCLLTEGFAVAHHVPTKDVLIQSVAVLMCQWVLLFVVHMVYSRKYINWRSVGFGVFGFTLIGLGFMCRQIEPEHCRPDSWFQLHALFHVLVAMGLLGLFIMFRSGLKRDFTRNEAEEFAEEVQSESSDLENPL